jgi:chromosome segregation ATPase
MSKSIFIHREWDVWAMLQHHQVVLLRSNEQLAWSSVQVADPTSRCEGLKEVGAADREEVRRLRDEFRSQNLEADRREEELRQVKESLRAVTMEQDEASLHVDCLSKSLEDERSEGQALNARIGGISPKLRFAFWVQTFFLATTFEVR